MKWKVMTCKIDVELVDVMIGFDKWPRGVVHVLRVVTVEVIGLLEIEVVESCHWPLE